MSKHTPGPWLAFFKHKYSEWHVSIPMSEGTSRWALFDDGVRSENPEGDARLIAAAPDLLEALEECLREHGGFTIRGECERRAKAAIAKATGAPT